MWHSRPPRDPPPFMANAILNFHFDYPHPSLMDSAAVLLLGLSPIFTFKMAFIPTKLYDYLDAKSVET